MKIKITYDKYNNGETKIIEGVKSYSLFSGMLNIELEEKKMHPFKGREIHINKQYGGIDKVEELA